MLNRDAAFLRQYSTPVETYAEGMKIVALLEEEMARLGENQAVGLAAPQIGILKRVAIVRVDGKAKHDPLSKLHVNLVNPQIVRRDGAIVFAGEGCLSCTEGRVATLRHRSILLDNLEPDGEVHRYLIGEDVGPFGLQLAHVIQHEVDHLNGVLCVDREHKANLIGRNDRCPCGSGKKFKKCCIDVDTLPI